MIHNDEHEAITVLVDYKANRHLRPFFCVRCGKCFCQLTGDAKVLIPGEPGEDEILDLNLRQAVSCRGTIYLGRDRRVKCTAKYIFQ